MVVVISAALEECPQTWHSEVQCCAALAVGFLANEAPFSLIPWLSLQLSCMRTKLLAGFAPPATGSLLRLLARAETETTFRLACCFGSCRLASTKGLAFRGEKQRARDH